MQVNWGLRVAGADDRITSYDVAIVGYGPTGMTLAALLAQSGRRVVVLERYSGLYNLPRAACFDDEAMRLFQKLGVHEAIARGAVPQRHYDWINAAGETLLEISYPDPAPCGWPALFMMFQPHVEDVLNALDLQQPTVDVRQGLTVTTIEQTDEDVELTAIDGNGRRTSFRARYAVGADGGNGVTQKLFRTNVADYGFRENWLVCDFRMLRTVPGLPSFRQICDPAQPISIVTIGPDHHRFSFMLDPGETPQEAVRSERVWRRVAGYITPNDAELIRAANYVFRSHIGTQWRHGRILLAGDAAHEMPPFLAQGMCSGLRDAHNLAWKLDLILSGKSEDALLDTYQIEREPHVRYITEKAIELGRVQTIRDPALAFARDERMLAARRANQAPDRLCFPALSDGVVLENGQLFPQGVVSGRSRTGLCDDFVGPGWLVVTDRPEIAAAARANRAVWSMIGGKVVCITSGGKGHSLVDVGGIYSAWFRDNGCRAAIVRPDWHCFGTASTPDELKDRFVHLGRKLRLREPY